MKSISKTLNQIVQAFGKPRLRPVVKPVRDKEKHVVSITKEDKKLIMKHVDELFAQGVEGSGERPV